MTIPEFNNKGILDEGIHRCTSEEFTLRFCYGEGSVRERYKKVLEQLFAFSVHRGVSSIIIAGSFVTNEKEPNDLDCIVIFPNEKSIPMQTDELLIVEECELDIMFVSETNKVFIYSLLNMFSRNRFEISVGMIEVILDEEKDRSTWNDYADYNSVEKLLEAREAYIHRTFIRGVPKKKVLVTVCNIDEYLYWNYEIAHIVSSAGWIYAPFIYRSSSVVNDLETFKSWIMGIYNTYETAISVFADGLGTYILAKYFKDDNQWRHICFDKIILSKAMLNPEFDWKVEFDSLRINLLINMKDANNTSKRNEQFNKSVTKDALYGDACKLGFSKKYEKLMELKYKYNDMIRVDEFKNNILPMFHISEALKENSNKEVWNEIANKEISMIDIMIKP